MLFSADSRTFPQPSGKKAMHLGPVLDWQGEARPLLLLADMAAGAFGGVWQRAAKATPKR